MARQLAANILQLSPATYKNPSQLPPGTVLVVGDGASGRQIAQELVATHPVVLSTGRARRVAPQRILGRDLFWWLDRLGVLQASRETAIGRYLMRADTFPGDNLRLNDLRRAGVTMVGRVVEADSQRVSFADGQTADVTTVIWATGYQEHTAWIDLPEAKDAKGHLQHHRGISPVPNLYLIGRSWQWTRGSALLHGVGSDSAYVTEHLVRHLRQGGQVPIAPEGASISGQGTSPLPPMGMVDRVR
jgi:putative flavoprotein involved in K+ transport